MNNYQINANQPIKAVIFDLDGTLADTLGIVVEAFYAAVNPRFGRRVERSEVTRYFGLSEEGILRNMLPDQWQEAYNDYLSHYERAHEHCNRLFDGLETLLVALQKNNVALGIVTGKGMHGTLISRRVLKLDRFFTAIETGEPHAAVKPECITRTLQRWGIAPEQAIYVGDAAYDMRASREAGVWPVAAAWAPHADVQALAAESPVALFNTVADFSDWCKLATLS